MGRNWCEDHKPFNPWNLVIHALVLPELVVVWLVFAVVFVNKLRTLDWQQTRGWTARVMLFLFSTAVYMLVGFSVNVLDYSLQHWIPQSVEWCAVARWMLWTGGGYPYLFLFEIYIHRLELPFEDTEYAVPRWVAWLYRAGFLIVAIVGNTLIIIYATEMNCWAVAATGFLRYTQVFPETPLYCAADAEFRLSFDERALHRSPHPNWRGNACGIRQGRSQRRVDVHGAASGHADFHER